jgi:hypothetical protein
VHPGERGDSLIEVVVSVAIAAIAVGAFAAGTIAAFHRFGADPVQSALEATVTREMRIAVDLLKYQGASVPPASVATTIPMPSGSPLSVQLTLGTSSDADGSVTVTITATSTNDTAKTASATQTIAAPAPLPGARIPAAAPGAAPQ